MSDSPASKIIKDAASAVAPKPKRSYTVPAILIGVAFFLYVVLLMRRSFVRNDQRLPFFWDRSLNVTLKKYVDILPSRYTMFLTGAYESGKSRTLYVLTDDLMKNERLVLNFDATKFNTTKEFVRHAVVVVKQALINLRPHLQSQRLKELQTQTKVKGLQSGLDPQLLGVYYSFKTAINKIIDEDGNVTSTGVREFFDVLDQYHERLRPVLFIHGGDLLYHSPLFQIVMSSLARKNQYQDYIPIVVELRDSSILFDLQQFGDMNLFRVATAGNLNETALDILIRTKSFTSYEIRKISSQIGSHGGPIAHILEDLKFDTKIEKAIENEIRTIETKVNELLPDLSHQRRNRFITKLCKSNGDAFIAERDELELYKSLFENGYLYTDELLRTHAANKAVLRAICAK